MIKTICGAPPIFNKWGETMGRMHLLTKSYKAADDAVQRDDWGTWNMDNPYLQQGRYHILLKKLKSLENTIASLPKDAQSYGLIHNDFHPYNFHINNDDITVFDFDDSIYGWFALDIAIAATHAVWWGSPAEDRKSKNEFAKRFLDEFLTGYFKHNDLDTYWVKQIPMFMDYRNICSYFWWLNSWDGDESRLSEFQQTAITQAINLIQSGQRFDGCDIQL
ncbi:phosphotransferase enzyme family protein [Paenibacillus sp. FSL M7-1046]|uniref:phosphotransferase enzyme family protein n=1 Tax=Paenibacillus sp. FSL M7-1046 TaxID=2975315 RepID=UPI0030FB6A7E